MKNSPQISAVVTCSLYAVVGMLLREIIVLKFPVIATRSLLYKKENIAKHNKKIIKKTLPTCKGKVVNDPSMLLESIENELSKTESLNKIPVLAVGRYSNSPKSQTIESDCGLISSFLKKTEIESLIFSGSNLGTVLLSFRPINN